MSATLFPGGSEVVLAALGNTLGGMSNLAVGKALPAGSAAPSQPAWAALLKKWGSPLLLLS